MHYSQTSSLTRMKMMILGEKNWGFFILFLVVPLIVSDYYLNYVNLILIYSLLTIGLNLLMGFAGLICLGYAGLFAVGAYSSVLLMTNLHFPFYLAFPLGGIFASAVGFLLAVPALRLSTIGLALVTFTFGEVIVDIIGYSKALGQFAGLISPPLTISTFKIKGDFHLFYLIYPVVFGLFILSANIMKSRIGRAFVALEDSPIAAQAMGVNLNKYKMLAFVISSFYAGIAGALFSPLVTIISPASFGLTESLLIVIMLVVGGVGTYFGPILGAALFVFLPELLREFKDYQFLMYGTVILAFMLFLPEGIYGRFLIWKVAWAKKKKGREGG